MVELISIHESFVPMKLHEVQTHDDYRLMYQERGVVIRTRLTELKEKGEATGAPPVGYRIVRLYDGTKHVEEDPVMMPLVREARELHASGRYSVRELLKIMTEKGLRSRTGKVMGVGAFWNVINCDYLKYEHKGDASVGVTT